MKIIKNKSELVGTAYMEIAPGKFAGKHWQDGSIFLDDGGFETKLYDIIAKSVPLWDYYDNTNIPRELGGELAANLAAEYPELAAELNKMLDQNENICFIGL